MISKKAVDFIILHEIGSKTYYERFLQKPTWPQGESGITIGFGYDLGYTTDKQFMNDWSASLNINFLTPLRNVIGLKGLHAKPMLKGEITNVRVPYNMAYDVFLKSSLPRYYKMALSVYPNLEKLNEDTQGAIVSLVYNRGNKLEGADRKEMKELVGLIDKQDYEGIADAIENSKRLWEGKLEGLVLRREAESDMVRESIA